MTKNVIPNREHGSADENSVYRRHARFLLGIRFASVIGEEPPPVPSVVQPPTLWTDDLENTEMPPTYLGSDEVWHTCWKNPGCDTDFEDKEQTTDLTFRYNTEASGKAGHFEMTSWNWCCDTTTHFFSCVFPGCTYDEQGSSQEYWAANWNLDTAVYDGGTGEGKTGFAIGYKDA